MKIRLNKNTISQMPEQVRNIVTEWKNDYRKSFISVENRPSFYLDEDAKVTMINLLTGANQSEQASGAFSGITKLSPCSEIPLPAGCVAVVTGFFCGTPWLTIYQGGVNQIAN